MFLSHVYILASTKKHFVVFMSCQIESVPLNLNYTAEGTRMGEFMITLNHLGELYKPWSWIYLILTEICLSENATNKVLLIVNEE